MFLEHAEENLLTFHLYIISVRERGAYGRLQLEDWNKPNQERVTQMDTCRQQCTQDVGLACILAFSFISLRPQMGDCLSAEQRQLYQSVKVRELAVVWSGDLFKASRCTVLAILVTLEYRLKSLLD